LLFVGKEYLESLAASVLFMTDVRKKWSAEIYVVPLALSRKFGFTSKGQIALYRGERISSL
jgi:hypothetical protein